MARYRVKVDDEDITDDVLEVAWRLGVRRPSDRVGDGRGRLVLDDPDGRYALERAGSLAFSVGAPLTVEMDDGGGWRRMFTGAVAYLEPQTGAYGRRLAALSFEAGEAVLGRCVARTPLLLDVRADAALALVLDHADLADLPRDLGVAGVRFASFGEQWGAGASALRVVQAITEAEGGYCMVDREGVLTFRGRLAGAGAPDATLDRLGVGAEYTYGAQVVNRVRVGVRPRRVGTPDTVLWTLDGAQRIRPNRDLRMVVRLREPVTGRAVGVALVETPVAGSDYVGNTQPDGLGADATGQLVVHIESVEGGAVALRIENTGANAAYLMAGARLRGTPILGGDVAWVERSAPASAAAYGPRTLSLSLPLLDSVEAGEWRADAELAQRADPRGQLSRITLNERAGLGLLAARTLFERVRVVDPHTGHDGLYVILGEQHVVRDGGARHMATWTLERVPDGAVWQVGVSGLGIETRLAG
jgi:hypothetical protein